VNTIDKFRLNKIESAAPVGGALTETKAYAAGDGLMQVSFSSTTV
jgi:hypothetical protein